MLKVRFVFCLVRIILKILVYLTDDKLIYINYRNEVLTCAYNPYYTIYDKGIISGWFLILNFSISERMPPPPNYSVKHLMKVISYNLIIHPSAERELLNR